MTQNTQSQNTYYGVLLQLKSMALRALFLCMVGIEAYLWLGAVIFYFVEFSELPKYNKIQEEDINITAVLEDFVSHTGKRIPFNMVASYTGNTCFALF